MDHDSSFLGTGWSFPPQFTDKGGDVQMASAADDIQQCLQILLATAQGERVMQENFGADLRAFQFEEIDQSLINRLSSLVSDAILYYEPRIALNNIDVSESPLQPGLLLIRIAYTIRSTNSRYNMIYPFYLNEAAGHA